MSAKSGRHFLQIPGPTNVPDRILSHDKTGIAAQAFDVCPSAHVRIREHDARHDWRLGLRDPREQPRLQRAGELGAQIG